MCAGFKQTGDPAKDNQPPQKPTAKKAAATKAAAKKAAAQKKSTVTGPTPGSVSGAACGGPQQPANADPELDVEAQPKSNPKGKAKGKAKQAGKPSAAGSQPPAKKAKVTWAGELGGAAAAPSTPLKRPAAAESDEFKAASTADKKTAYTIMLYKSRGIVGVREVGNGGKQVLQAQMPTLIKIT